MHYEQGGGGPGLCCMSCSCVLGLQQSSCKLPCLMKVCSFAHWSLLAGAMLFESWWFLQSPPANTLGSLSSAHPCLCRGHEPCAALCNDDGAFTAQHALAKAILNPLAWDRASGVCVPGQPNLPFCAQCMDAGDGIEFLKTPSAWKPILLVISFQSCSSLCQVLS